MSSTRRPTPADDPSGADPVVRSRTAGFAAGAVAGLLSGAAAVAASEAVTALLDGVSSPLLAVGNRAVDAAPRPVKEWAIETFGTADKPVLIGGVIATVALLAVVAGVVGVRRPRLAVGIFLALSAVAGAAALTDRAATAGPALRLLPVLVLVVAGLAALMLLLRPFRAREVREATSAGAGVETDAASRRTAGQAEAPGRPGTAAGARRQPADLPERRDGDRLPVAFDRRAFLRAAAAVGAVAAAGGIATRALGGSAAAAARADLMIPAPAVPAPPIPRAPPSTSPASRRTSPATATSTAWTPPCACPTYRSTAGRCGSMAWSTGS
ncbi:hypothetical protein [Nocardioides mesophilus]|uniref:hypothetical protein n=1 Tax=Nocardioides mesophilus TaxID=433659 RepID=UPI001FE4F09F|nr:hypothetical protein [Nocardioides mesophilus]